MSPRLLIPLALAMAASGFELVRILGPEKRNASEAGAQAPSKADPAGCESCKNTPTNRFALLAKQDGPSREAGLDAVAGIDVGPDVGSRLSKRWAKRALLANASAEVLEEEIQKFKGLGFRMNKDADFLFAVARLADPIA